MSEHSETQREVLTALLDIYCTEADCRPTPEYGEWLQRFDAAALRTAQLEVFVETLSELMAQWVKEKIVETAQWIKPSEKLPEEQQEVLVLLDWRDSAQPLSEVLYSIAIFGMYAGDEGNERRWYTDDHGALLTADVAYWRPLPAPPMEVLK